MIATQGWAKPGFFIKTQPSGFNWFKPGFNGFYGLNWGKLRFPFENSESKTKILKSKDNFA